MDTNTRKPNQQWIWHFLLRGDKSNMIIVIDFRKRLLWTTVCLWLFFWKRREERERKRESLCLESKRIKERGCFSSNSTRAFSVWTFINSADMLEKKRPLYKGRQGWGGWYRRGDMNHVKAERNLTLPPYVSHMCCAIYSMCSGVYSSSWSACQQPCFLCKEDGIWWYDGWKSKEVQTLSFFTLPEH